jgi:two-component system cell cycle response regulator CpdR
MPRTVLVVDDEALVLDVTVSMLEDMGCDVVTATNGADALSILAGDPRIEILITDINMPGMSGFELAERAGLRHPRLRVLLLSGRETAAHALQYMVSKSIKYGSEASRRSLVNPPRIDWGGSILEVRFFSLAEKPLPLWRSAMSEFNVQRYALLCLGLATECRGLAADVPEPSLRAPSFVSPACGRNYRSFWPGELRRCPPKAKVRGSNPPGAQIKSMTCRNHSEDAQEADSPQTHQ